jgi:hypothetical protein
MEVDMDDQIAELKLLCTEVFRLPEGGITYYLLQGFPMKEGCSPGRTDLLLCPVKRDDYPSRLFFADRITSPKAQNWHNSIIRILDRNWHVFSWRLNKPHARLASILLGHLGAL